MLMYNGKLIIIINFSTQNSFRLKIITLFKKNSQIIKVGGNRNVFIIIYVNFTLSVFGSSNLRKIGTGCESIDEILHGGVPVNGIVELFGKSGVGKTQFCIQLSLMVQLPERFGGLNKGLGSFMRS